MNFPLDTDTVSHGIQLAVAPVFLLTAVSGMIGVVASRLARIIDRARLVEERMKKGPSVDEHASDQIELGELRTRGLLANGSIGLLTLCAFLIGATIVVLFLGETIELKMLRLPMITFLAGVVCFMLALACFMAETMIATRLLNFGKHRR
jgi:CHASE2 domain-containing sensor protein